MRTPFTVLIFAKLIKDSLAEFCKGVNGGMQALLEFFFGELAKLSFGIRTQFHENPRFFPEVDDGFEHRTLRAKMSSGHIVNRNDSPRFRVERPLDHRDHRFAKVTIHVVNFYFSLRGECPMHLVQCALDIGKRRIDNEIDPSLSPCAPQNRTLSGC